MGSRSSSIVKRVLRSGRGAEAVRDAITSQVVTLPEQLRRSLTWDQRSEITQHAQLTIDIGLQVHFCDAQSPWQRGMNENTNGLLRQYFPKGTTSQDAPPTTSRRSLPRSAADHARHSAGAHPQKRSTSIYDPSNSKRCKDRLNPPSRRCLIRPHLPHSGARLPQPARRVLTALRIDITNSNACCW
jgi:hypothetical protein